MKNILKKVCSFQNRLYICISNQANNNLKNKKNEKFNYNLLRKFNGFYGTMERSSYL